MYRLIVTGDKIITCSSTLRNTPGCDWHKQWLRFEGEAAHAYEVLCDFCQPLFVLVHQKFGPVSQVLVNLLQGLDISLLQPAVHAIAILLSVC